MSQVHLADGLAAVAVESVANQDATVHSNPSGGGPQGLPKDQAQ